MKSLSSALRSYTAVATAILLPLAARSQGQAAGERPQFEVASIKLNNGCQNNRNSEPPPRPGLLQIGCVTLQNLIQVAYAGIVKFEPIMQQVKITRGPGWLQSDFYSIAAKADGPAAVEVMIGPMMQALLEERFKLKVHRETREEPVYSMTVGKNGLKIQPAAEGSCIPIDLNHLPEPQAPGQPSPNLCGRQSVRFDRGMIKAELHGVTDQELSDRLSSQLERPVVDKTGVAGMFDINLEFAPDPTMRGFGGRGPGDASRGVEPSPLPTDPVSPTIFTALQEQVGLKVASDKAPAVGYLVIDHVERATDN